MRLSDILEESVSILESKPEARLAGNRKRNNRLRTAKKLMAKRGKIKWDKLTDRELEVRNAMVSDFMTNKRGTKLINTKKVLKKKGNAAILADIIDALKIAHGNKYGKQDTKFFLKVEELLNDEA